MLQPNPSNSAAIVRARLQARKSEQVAGPAGQQRATLEQLAREVRQLETVGKSTESQRPISTGCAALDDCLPYRGYAAGSVIEYLRASAACGASYLALAAAASAMRASDGFLVIASTRHEIYPPALLCHGIPLDKTIFVRPESQADLVWSVDQSLRTPAVAAVVAELDVLDDRAARRLQLAAEHGKGLGLLLRSMAARRAPSWAEVQWIVRGAIPSPTHSLQTPNLSSQTPMPALQRANGRQLDVKLARVRGGSAGVTLQLEINPTTGELTTREIATNRNVRERNRHERNGDQPACRPDTQPGNVRLAAELASAASPSGRTRTG